MMHTQQWPRFSDHRCAYMGQGVTCEKTSEGGTLCSDGTYHKPGCGPNMPPVRAEEAERGIPTTALVVGIGGAAAVAAILLLATR